MGEKKQLNVSLGTVICIVIIFVLIICMMGMYIHYNARNSNISGEISTENKTENTVTNNEVTESKPEVKKVSKIDDTKELVYSVYNKMTSEYSYNIPAINIDSDDVKTINNEIDSYYKSRAEEGSSATKIKYESYTNENTLSLLISIEYPNDCIYYKAYNVDIYTGKRITNEELIKAKNVSEKELTTKIKELAKAKYASKYSKLSDDAMYDEQLNKTIADKNCTIDNYMFLNEDGKISVVVDIYSLAGADKYEEIIEINF